MYKEVMWWTHQFIFLKLAINMKKRFAEFVDQQPRIILKKYLKFLSGNFVPGLSVEMTEQIWMLHMSFNLDYNERIIKTFNCGFTSIAIKLPSRL